MARKYSNSEAEIFGVLLRVKSVEKAKEVIKEEFYTGCTEVEKERILKTYERELSEVKAFYDKIKFFEKTEIYKVNVWGYGQRNFENLKVIGEVGNSVVITLDATDIWDVWVVSKKKFRNKEFAKLDNVRSTSWEKPYTYAEISEQEEYNAYYGY